MLETRHNMFNRYQPYKTAPSRASLCCQKHGSFNIHHIHTIMSLEDAVEVSATHSVCVANYITQNKGHDILHHGLSHLSDRVLLKVLEAERPFRDSVVYRVSRTKAEIESAGRQKELLKGVLTEAQGNLDDAESQLSLLRQVVDERGLEEARDDAEYYHAVFADELVVLTIADGQVEQMEFALKTRQCDSDEVASIISL